MLLYVEFTDMIQYDNTILYDTIWLWYDITGWSCRVVELHCGRLNGFVTYRGEYLFSQSLLAATWKFRWLMILLVMMMVVVMMVYFTTCTGVLFGKWLYRQLGVHVDDNTWYCRPDMGAAICPGTTKSLREVSWSSFHTQLRGQKF